MPDKEIESSRRGLGRAVYLALGWLFVGIGIAGAVLPLLPTTPFLLIAMWAFTRSSPKAAAWLRGHPRLGSYICDWQDRGVIPPRAKALAIVMMSASFAWISLATASSFMIKAIIAATLLSVAIFIVTRPGN